MTTKLSEMSDKESKKWLNQVQNIKNMNDSKIEDEIEKLQKKSSLSEQEREKLEQLAWEKDYKKKQEKLIEERQEKSETELSLKQKTKESFRRIPRKLPGLAFRMSYYLLMAVAAFLAVLGIFKNGTMLYYALGSLLGGNYAKFLAKRRKFKVQNKDYSENKLPPKIMVSSNLDLEWD